MSKEKPLTPEQRDEYRKQAAEYNRWIQELSDNFPSTFQDIKKTAAEIRNDISNLATKYSEILKNKPELTRVVGQNILLEPLTALVKEYDVNPEMGRDIESKAHEEIANLTNHAFGYGAMVKRRPSTPNGEYLCPKCDLFSVVYEGPKGLAAILAAISGKIKFECEICNEERQVPILNRKRLLY
jgi:hypothetical protein